MGGCSTAITGTPVATPGEGGKAATGAALASTTCREYTEMNSAARSEVIAAIGAEGNDLVAANPDLWAGWQRRCAPSHPRVRRCAMSSPVV